MTRSTAPRPTSAAFPYLPGDAVTVGSTRWLIRSIVGDEVTLEASNAPAGIIWHTTLDKLPERKKETNS